MATTHRPLPKDELGRRGERIAADFLEDAGHRILDRNWRCSVGELDLVTDHAGWIVAVEVKTRSSLDYGHPFEAIDARKLRRLQRLGRLWCEAHERPRARTRVDAVAVLLGGADPVVEHLERVG